MNNEPSYFGLTNDHTWLSVDEDYYKKLKPTHRMKCYTHPAKTLTDEKIKDALYVADITLDNLSDGDISMERIKAFIRIVLRKAQEK